MQAFLLGLLKLSVYGGITILVVMLARLLLKNAPKKWSYLLWAVPAFRLCCPFGIRSHLSLFGLISNQPVSGSAYTAESFVYYTVSSWVPAAEASGPVSFAQEALPSAVPSAPQPQDVSSTAGRGVDIFTVLFLIWLGVASAMLILNAVRYLRLRRSLASAERDGSGVYVSDRVDTPFVMGFLNPRIYLPRGIEQNEKPFVLAHERCHISRCDNIIKPFAFVLLAFHWFNPLCWIALRLMTDDMELSCDESVLASGDDIRREYSRTLLALAVRQRHGAQEAAFGQNAVSRRIKNALRFKKANRFTSLIAALLCLIVTVACATDPAIEAPLEDEAASAAASPTEAVSEPASHAAKPIEIHMLPSDRSEVGFIVDAYWVYDAGELSRSVFYYEANTALKGQAPRKSVTGAYDSVFFVPEGDLVSVYDSMHTVLAAHMSGEHYSFGSESGARYNDRIAQLPGDLFPAAAERLNELAVSAGAEYEQLDHIEGFIGENFAVFTKAGLPGRCICCIFCTEDGATWRETMSFSAYGAKVTGACVLSPDEAYICTSRDRVAAVYRTADRGATWQQVSLPLPEDYNDCVSYAVYTPVFDGQRGVMLASISIPGVETAVPEQRCFRYITEDGGVTWQYIHN